MLPIHCALAHTLVSVDCFIAIVTTVTAITISSTTVIGLTASKAALTAAAKTKLA